MKKPKKYNRLLPAHPDYNLEDDYQYQAYNLACNDWEKWLLVKLQELTLGFKYIYTGNKDPQSPSEAKILQNIDKLIKEIREEK